MQTKHWLCGMGVLALLLVAASGAAFAAPPYPSGEAAARDVAPIIIDHNTVDITAIPQFWIEEAKRELHIVYGHTSHGSQLTTGMTGLVGFANGGGRGLALPQDIFTFNGGGSDGALDLREGVVAGDVGYYPQWVNETRAYLGDPTAAGRGENHPEINVVIWSWCGQVSARTEQTMIDTYLAPMTQLEADYPGIVFVYMTGHADGTGETGNLHLRNQQIRDYALANNKVLYDFYTIELYDPDGDYYGDQNVNDNCDYDSDGDGSLDRNWATDWQGAHTQNVDWYSCSCVHSQALNCNQKAYAAWWLWARLAGWSGVAAEVDLSPSFKSVTPAEATHGDTVTYTVAIRSGSGPFAPTVHASDVLPTGLLYVPGSLTATSGVINDSAAPHLVWSGNLSETTHVTLTYAATVTYTVPGSSAILPARLVNSATLTVAGYAPVAVAASLLVNQPVYRIYLPLVVRLG